MVISKLLQVTTFVAIVTIAAAQEIELHDSEIYITTELPHSASGIFFNPTNLTKTRSGIVRFVEFQTNLDGAHHAEFSVADEGISIVTGFEFKADFFDNDGNTTGSGSFNVSALFVGYNVITLTIYNEDNSTLGTGKIQMSVVLSYQKLNQIFTYILGVLVSLVYVGMGATIDLQVVKQIAKRPIGPIVGIICQYGFMPVIAFALAKIFFSSDSLMQLGLFLNGASPGGGSSNMWTLILGGSLDLSIMMTFISTLVAFAAVPIWVLSLGPQIVGADSDFEIPYGQIAMIVVLLVIPCGIGLGIQFCSPKAAKFVETRILKKFSIFMIVFIFTFGIYSYRYVFQLLTWKVLLSCFGLPGLGYVSGILMSLLTRRNLADTIAISIETGVQNANIAIVILKVTLEAPSGDLAVVIPACCVLMTPIPLLFAILLKKVYERIRGEAGKDIAAVEKAPQQEKSEVVSSIPLDITSTIVASESDFHNNNRNNYDTFVKTENSTSLRKLEGIDNPAADFKDDHV